MELALGPRRERRLGTAERVGVLRHQRVHLVIDLQLGLVLGDDPIEHRLERDARRTAVVEELDQRHRRRGVADHRRVDQVDVPHLGVLDVARLVEAAHRLLALVVDDQVVDQLDRERRALAARVLGVAGAQAVGLAARRRQIAHHPVEQRLLVGGQAGDVEARDRRAVDGRRGAGGAAARARGLVGRRDDVLGIGLRRARVLLARRAGQEADRHHGEDRADDVAAIRAVFVDVPRRLHARVVASALSRCKRGREARVGAAALTGRVTPGTSATE